MVHFVLFGQNKIGEVGEDPFVFQGSIDDPQQLASQRDDRFSRASALLSLVVLLQIGTIALRDQRALHQGRAAQLAAPFGDSSRAFGLIGMADAGHDTEIGGQLAFIGKVPDIANDRQQDAGAEPADPLDTGQVLVPFQLLAFSLDDLLH